MDIKRRVKEITVKARTNNPSKIALMFGIQVVKRPYSPALKGYYLNLEGSPFIVINQNHDILLQKIILSHELGHAFLHSNTTSLLKCMQQDFDFFPYGTEQEFQANMFAAELLLDGSQESFSYLYRLPPLICKDLLGFKMIELGEGFQMYKDFIFEQNFHERIW